MAMCLESGVEMSGVLVVRLPDRFGEGIFMRGNPYDVDMVGHETVRQDAHSMCARILTKQGQVDYPVMVIEEDLLPVVAPLRNMMRNTGQHDACCSGHIRVAPLGV